MRKSWLKDTIIDGLWQYFQMILLMAVLVIPMVLNFQNTIENELLDTSKTTDIDIIKIVLLFLIKKGNIFIGIGLCIFVFMILRKNNEGRRLNSGNHYHVHTYVYYWVCSHILGFKNCSLILVPVYMQIKLIINEVFPEFYYGDDSFYKEEQRKEDLVRISEYNTNNSDAELVNIIVSDTYPIDLKSIPQIYLSNYTICIERIDNQCSKSRVYSPALVEALNNQICKLSGSRKINLFATTNPKNLYFIANNSFKKAGRTNITNLYVFTQNNGSLNDWKFDDCGKRLI